jgi:hypothetical protein
VDREQEIAAIVAEARKQRRPMPRGLWITAGVIGAVCAIGFAIAMIVRSEPASTGSAPAAATGTGFVSGLGLGIAIGLAVGFAVARQVSAHSSRSKP